MNLEKFVLLLTDSVLYLPTVHELANSDPYEGLTTRLQTEVFAQSMAKNPDSCEGDGMRQLQRAAMIASGYTGKPSPELLAGMMLRMLRHLFVVSCWHLSENESEAMWKLYSTGGAGVAIESTIGKLSSLFSGGNSAVIAPVKYRNFEADQDPNAAVDYLFHKRLSYEHEKELRAVVFKSDYKLGGRAISCNPAELITCVHVAPSASQVFQAAVERLRQTFIPQIALKKSLLLTEPDY